MEVEATSPPSGWETRPLGQLLVSSPMYGLNAPAAPYDDRLPTYVRITDITEDGRFDHLGRASVRHPEASNYLLEAGDLVVARTGNTVGKSYFYRPNDGPLAFAGFLIRLRPDDRVLHPGYLKYFMQTRAYWRWVGLNSMRTGQPGINGRQFAQLPVTMPRDVEEQEAIAEALSDADALIESLEQLLSKKRLIKQGAMQELLTGKRRLRGFEGVWMPTTLGQLGATYGGLTGKTKADFGRGEARYIPFLNVVTNSIVDPDFLEAVRVQPGENQNRAAFGDLFFNGSSETPEEVGLCAVLREAPVDLYLNSFCFGFRPYAQAELDGLYLAYFFRGPQGRDLMKSLAQGSTRYNLSKRALLEAEFRLPRADEQRAIAQVLYDMDAEIDALAAKLRKARMIKEGMMYNLLTGKIRLV